MTASVQVWGPLSNVWCTIAIWSNGWSFDSPKSMGMLILVGRVRWEWYALKSLYEVSIWFFFERNRILPIRDEAFSKKKKPRYERTKKKTSSCMQRPFFFKCLVRTWLLVKCIGMSPNAGINYRTKLIRHIPKINREREAHRRDTRDRIRNLADYWATTQRHPVEKKNTHVNGNRIFNIFSVLLAHNYKICKYLLTFTYDANN